MSKFKIEKNIPVPLALKTRQKWPFGEMEVGESFSVTEKEFQSLISAAHYYGSRHNKKFSCQRMQLRCWRVA